MQIMTQDHRKLVNGDYVSQFFIEQTENNVKLMAAVVDDVDILLGTYDKIEHAKRALEFIGFCLVNENAQGKITAVPTRENMKHADELLSNARNLGDMRTRGGEPENFEGASNPDILSLLKSLLD